MRIQVLWQRLRQTGALMVGVPDYAAYVRHMREQHPELAPLSEGEFVKARMEARYGGHKTGKCPC